MRYRSRRRRYGSYRVRRRRMVGLRRRRSPSMIRIGHRM